MPTENRITEQPDEVKRYRFKGAAGEYVYAGDFDNAARCFLDATERCLAAERREQALQLRLDAADQRIDELTAHRPSEVNRQKTGIYRSDYQRAQQARHPHKPLQHVEEWAQQAKHEMDDHFNFRCLNIKYRPDRNSDPDRPKDVHRYTVHAIESPLKRVSYGIRIVKHLRIPTKFDSLDSS